MAKRPVFVVSDLENKFVLEKNTDFNWYPGFSKVQKQKSVESLHDNFLKNNRNLKILEISTSSKEKLGVNLSAFNLMILDINGKMLCSVESLFQSSKKFENGGPYKDLLNKSSVEAKKDPRLKTSGKLMCFMYKNEQWELEPKTYFYDWIYINAVHQHEDLRNEIIKYDGFTDIAFNPAKSINCQAKAAALYVSLFKRGLINDVIANRHKYLDIIK